MAIARRLIGRMEKRISIAIVVHLTRSGSSSANGAELTYTDNVSGHGARVVSSRPWQLGEMALVTPLHDEMALRGMVVYCEKLASERYGIGLDFQDRRVTWSRYRAYNGG